jgi:hypothetical protein
MAAGAAPAGWTAVSGAWKVEANATALSAPNVVRQSETDKAFPVLTLDSAKGLADVDVGVKFNVLSGEKAQAGGVVFRFVDGGNYYTARANGNEGNFALFRLIGGNRVKLMEAEAPTGTSTWLQVRVEARGSAINVYNATTKLFTWTETEADAPKAGGVGIWTKDDSVTLFDDFRATGYTTGAAAAPAGNGTATSKAVDEDFDDAAVGSAPAGWRVVAGTWAVEANGTAPSKPNVIRQSATDAAFPILLFEDAGNFTDVEAAVSFSVLSGAKAQAGGVVFRFVDKDNYYAARANGNEGNYAVFHTIHGNRTKMADAEAPTGVATWLNVRVVAKGDTITLYSGGTKLLETKETSADAPKTGGVGLWTKDDSVTLFDSFEAEST